MTRIKICGITNLKDALLAELYGADAVGFIFFPESKRYITPEKVQNIIKHLNPFISKVGVFVNLPIDEVNSISKFCGLTHVQLHGEETIKMAQLFNLPVIKSLSYHEQLETQLTEWNNYHVLVDSGTKSERGGTGKTLPWESLVQKLRNKKIALAGGLTPENVTQAIRIVHPVAVDVSSGVENVPGIKDETKLRRFIESVKELNEIL